MIGHYLNLAWQQLTKYRLQSVVSIVSLAIGFACFALASMWIKYETTYDAFHKDAENLYVLMHGKNEDAPSKLLETRLLYELPQLEQLSIIYKFYASSINGLSWYESRRQAEWSLTDTNFVSLVGFQLKEGTTSFVHNPNEVAISSEMAARLWGDESPIGKELVTVDEGYKQTRIVTAVFDKWGRHSNFNFDFVSRMTPDRPSRSRSSSHNIVVMAHISPKADIEELNRRLGEIELYESDERKLCMRPITKVRHFTTWYEQSARTKLHHIYLFALASGLLIVCGLLNYLTMFINRLFIRKREMALRTVFGATGRDLMLQFLTEYGLLLAIAMGFGLMTVSLSAEWFLSMTSLPRDMGYIHRESLIYLLLVTIVSLLISLPAIWYFRRQSLQSSITGVGALTRYYIFRRFSVALQIAISIFSIFCTVVFMKQLDSMRSNDIGFELENRMMWRYPSWSNGRNWEEEKEGLFHFVKQCSEVDTAFITGDYLFPGGGSYTHVSLENDPESSELLRVDHQYIYDELKDFYGMQLIEGRWLDEGEPDENILVNESFVHKMGWSQGVGKKIYRTNGYSLLSGGKKRYSFEELYIVGIVKDMLTDSPTTPATPTMYCTVPINVYSSFLSNWRQFLLKYKPGMKEALRNKVQSYYKEHDLSYDSDSWIDFEERYDYYLRSELNLQKLLNIITGVCILIALFGVWSMIMLTCEQRRKEIAVRKVFGATTKDILDMFIVEYMALQGVAALVAFPIGYACMKPWLEQYVVQTSIPWWIYVGIFLMVALLVAICVGWRVWKTATAHPADEICKG